MTMTKTIALMEQKSNTQATRGETFVGYRPVVFKSKKYDKKTNRRDGKRICREY